MSYTWHAVDLLTGERGPELRMQQRGTVSRIIGEATDSQNSVLCWDAETGKEVDDWRYWTEPGRMMAVMVDDEDRPVWGGTILRRVPTESEWVPIAMATLESYFDRRYAGDLFFATSDQSSTIAWVLVTKATEASGVPFILDCKPTGVLRDRTYPDRDDKTTLTLLTDLMNIQNGIEFTVDLEWLDAEHKTLGFFFRSGSRIGKSLPQPIRFEHPGAVKSFQVIEDYTRENGANDVMAVSSGEGLTRPESVHMVDEDKLDAGWVRYERRFTPSTGISEQATLDAYAAEELVYKKDGLFELSMVLNLDNCPRLNADWWLGDDVTAAITAPAYPEWRDADYAVHPGYERTVRVVGWTLNADDRTLVPSLREA